MFFLEKKSTDLFRYTRLNVLLFFLFLMFFLVPTWSGSGTNVEVLHAKSCIHVVNMLIYDILFLYGNRVYNTVGLYYITNLI